MNKKLLLGVNLALRLAIFYFLAETMLHPADPRFAGKAIPIRNLLIVTGATFVFPFLYFKRRSAPYPYISDTAYLSIFALDMAGNSFNLYDSLFWFDLLPHFHGTGVATLIFYLVVLSRMAFGKIRISRLEAFLLSFGVATILHTALEAQEFYTDVFAQTHNVRGTFDVINDIVAGFLGSIVYVALFEVFAKTKTKYKLKIILTPLGGLFAQR